MFKTKEFGLETPEPGESPAATGQLEKFAEQIDALFRKQLTKLFEVAKLRVTETLEIPSGSIVASDIKENAVTESKIAAGAIRKVKIGGEQVGFPEIAGEAIRDSLIVAGRALVDTENAYSAPAIATTEVELEPSASRPVFVTVKMVSEAPLVAYIFCGGVEIGVVQSDTSERSAFSFICPPGVKWKPKGSGVTYSYLPL